MVRKSCKGHCDRDNWEYKDSLTKTTSKGVYSQGYKRCSNCDIFIKISGFYCPCCNGNLKVKPRLNSTRRNYNETVCRWYPINEIISTIK